MHWTTFPKTLRTDSSLVADAAYRNQWGSVVFHACLTVPPSWGPRSHYLYGFSRLSIGRKVHDNLFVVALTGDILSWPRVVELANFRLLSIGT